MAWKQVKPFVQSKGGTTPNMCLANVRSGYQIKNLLPDAWTAWQQTEQHKDTPPKGVDVPIFFSYTATIDGTRKNWGHIGVQLKSGKFWSDGVTYTNIAAYTANHSPKYVGWGESVNNETVIKEEEVKTSRTDSIWLNRVARYLHSPTDRQKNGWAGRDLSTLLSEIYATPWFKKQALAVKDYDRVVAENKKLKAEAANAGDANLMGKALIELIARFGYKKG